MHEHLSRHSICVSVLLVTTLWMSSCAIRLNPEQQRGPVHARVIWTENPMEHAIITWTTLYESRNNKVYYDTLRRNGKTSDYAFSAIAERSGKVTMKAMDYQEGVPEGYYHHTSLNNLKPGTAYYFVVESNGKRSNEFYFITAPQNPTSMKLLAGGDSRLGGEQPRYAGRTPHLERQRLKSLIAMLVEQYPEIYGFVHGADYGTTADWRHLYWYFEDLQRATASDGRILPMLISMGNHDTSIGFMENFYLGESLNDYISFNYFYSSRLTNDISLITLNTEISLGGVQYQWLKNELPRLREESRWLLVNYHKPAFPAYKDPDDFRFARVRQYWVPLFEKHKIDLAIESDGHTLKRTPPILNGRVDPEGIVYIGEGGLGAPLRQPDTTRWFLQGGFAARLFHVWMLDISKDEINMQAIDIDGNVADSYTIRK
jgi:acid phosphatase type 7